MTIGSSKLAGAPQDRKKQLANSVKLLLLWVAASDGKLEETELEYVSTQFPDSEGTITTKDFLAVIRKSDLRVIEKATLSLTAESRELRVAFLDMAITMSMADRDIAIAENHILRFYADALHLGIGILQKRFQAISGVEFPEPDDPGSATWWDQTSRSGSGIEQGKTRDAYEYGEIPAGEKRAGRSMSIARAHAILGLNLNATPGHIETAYQNLANIFQVDRVEAMGSAAVTIANARFRKIQEAYRLLRA